MTDTTLAPRRFSERFAGPRTATLVLCVTAVCFGLVPLFARELQGAGIGSPAIAFYRYALSALVLLPFLPRPGTAVWREKRPEALMMFGAGVMMGLGWIAYLEAIKVAPVAAAGVIYMSYPMFAVLFAWALVGQRPTRRALLAGGLVLLAAGATLSPDALAGGQIMALVGALPAPIAFAFIIVLISAKVQRLGTLERMAAGMAGSTVGLLPLVLAAEGPVIPGDAETLLWIAGIAGVTAFVPQLLYTMFARRVGPARAAATGSLELPVMMGVGFLAFGEALGPREILACILVLAAIFTAPAVRPVAAGAVSRPYRADG